MHKLTRTETKKLFFKSKLIFKTAFFHVKIHYISSNEVFLKNIIVVPKKCGIAVRRNYIRRATKFLIKKYNVNSSGHSFIFFYIKNNLDSINYDALQLAFVDFMKVLAAHAKQD
jgi:ribonuclease P protein component